MYQAPEAKWVWSWSISSKLYGPSLDPRVCKNNLGKQNKISKESFNNQQKVKTKLCYTKQTNKQKFVCFVTGCILEDQYLPDIITQGQNSVMKSSLKASVSYD